MLRNHLAPMHDSTGVQVAPSCMVDFWMLVSDWFMGLGRAYGVDPVIFGSIYVATIPFFWGSVAWIVRNARCGRSVTVPAVSTCFFMVAAYVYPFWVGENLPLWTYLAVGGCVAYCGITTLRKVRSAARASKCTRAFTPTASRSANRRASASHPVSRSVSRSVSPEAATPVPSSHAPRTA